MIKPKSGILYIILFVSFILNLNIYCNNDEGNKLLTEGIEYYRNTLYKQAIINFRDILINPDFNLYHADAFFWISKSYMVLGKLKEAEKNIEYYLLNFPTHADYLEALYQKGRLFFMQNEYENAIQIFSSFIEKYPNSIFQSNAYYWIGESLYMLGKLDDALKIFKNIVQTYPDSFKFEAAKYRMSIIEFKRRENELLKLLKWSHMESLKSLDEFQKKERTYEQAISSYQKRIASVDNTTEDNFISKIAEKDNEIDKLKKENLEFQKTIQSLETQISSMTTSISSSTDNTAKTTGSSTLESEKIKLTEKLLKVKSDALTLKAQLLDILADSMGGK